ncbi:SdpI family protein [Jonesiaceae bacterium BS-20]|uniref:SdpI family protein n=1 Tax=Jonesiaceae bacterium BS-20 TaxID=3120821 RepID=A0AAU7DYI7_9MICO
MIFGWILIILSIFVVTTTLLAANGKIAPNGLLGIRTPATQRGESQWRKAHLVASWLLIPSCTVASIVGIVFIGKNTSDTVGQIALLAFLVLAGISAILADRAARAVQTP